MNSRPKSAWELRCEAAEAELGELRNRLNEHCACIHDGRGSLTNECEEHRECREQRDELLAVLLALTRDDRFQLAIGGNPNAVGDLMRQVDAVVRRATEV